MNDLSVGAYVRASVCPVHCGKNGGSDPGAVWHHRSDGSRNEASGGVCGSVHGKGTFGANLRRAIVTNREFTAYVCDSASAVAAAVWGGACAGPRHCFIRWGSTSCNGKGRFWGFVPRFHNGKCH